MPRRKGWKPLSYTKIAEICASLVKGSQIGTVARLLDVAPHTVKHLRSVLLRCGIVQFQSKVRLTADLDSQIWDLVKNTTLTNTEIAKRLNLSCTQPARDRRRKYHRDLKAAGLPVPLCKCGDEFQHSHKCRFMRTYAKPTSPTEAPEIIKQLIAGTTIGELMATFAISRRPAEKLLARLTKKQRARRRRAVLEHRSQNIRRRAVATRSAGLFGRLDAKVSRDLPPDIRSETLQLMALAILDGKETEAEALKHVSRYSGQAFGQLTDRWKTVSIDEDRDGVSLGDMIEDETALEEFSRRDDLELADEW